MAIQVLMLSFTQTLLIINDQKISSLLFWLAGSVAGKDWSMVALMIAFSLGKSASIISLGEDVARGLGQNMKLLRESPLGTFRLP